MSRSRDDLADKIVMITGGTGGIGAATGCLDARFAKDRRIFDVLARLDDRPIARS